MALVALVALRSIASIFRLPRWLPFLWLFSSLVSQQASQYSFRGATGKLRLLALVIVVGDATVAAGFLAAAAMTIHNLVRLLDKLGHPIAKLAHGLPLQGHRRK